MRKIAGLVVLLASIVALAPAPAYAAPAAGTPITVMTPSVAAFLPGQQAWVSVVLKGGSADSCDVRVTAVLTGAGVGYPENTAAFTAPYRDADLNAFEMDYIALNFAVPATMTSVKTADLSVSYNTCDAKNKGSFKGNGQKNGHQGQEIVIKASTNVPVNAVTGASATQVTSVVGPIKAGTPQWVDVSFLGRAPNLTNFRFRITDKAGATVVYAKDGTDSGLANAADLGVLREDKASVRISVDGLKPGSYTLKTEATYGSARTTLPGTLTLIVA